MKISNVLNKKQIIVLLILIAAGCLVYLILNNKKDGVLDDKKAEIDLSFVESVENIAIPTFPDNMCNIVDYGAVKISDETENNNVESFKKAIEDCANKGGGKVSVPAGEWLVNGPIHLKSNINLFLEEGAIITFSSDPNDYLPVVKTRYEGIELMNFSPMIYAPDCVNVAITGKGVVQKVNEPNGWDGFKKKADKAEKRLYDMSMEDIPIKERIFGKIEDYMRVSFVQPYNSKNVLIEGVTFRDGPMWTIHPLYTENLIIRDVKVRTSQSNTDGIAIDSCNNVLIENNDLATGDDAIVIKSGKDKDGWRVGKSSQNIVIRNNVISEGHGAVTIGSEMSGDIKNVLVENITVVKSDQGLRIKSRVGRGGLIENVLYKNISIKNTGEAIKINFRYGGKSSKPKTTKEPEMKNIEFRDIKIGENRKKTVIEIIGLENKMSNITFKNIEAKGESIFVNLEDSNNIYFENVNVPTFKLNNSSGINILNDTCANIEKEKSSVNMVCGGELK